MLLLLNALLLAAAPVNGGTVSFKPDGPGTVWVDAADKKLVAVVNGGATGTWLHVSGRIHFSCDRNPVKTVRAEVAGAPGAVELAVGDGVLRGGSVEASIPFARLSDIERCPGQTLTRTLNLTMTCEAGLASATDAVTLEVSCEKPSGSTRQVFTRHAAVILSSGMRDGKAPIEVKAPWLPDGPLPLSLGVLVLDEAGKEVFARREVWKASSKGGVSGWQSVTVPSPPVGKYGLYYEAKWADGSTSRSAREPLQVTTAAERKAVGDEVRARWKDISALEERMKAKEIDLCDEKVVVPWLRAQPEVESVTIRAAGYSYLMKKSPVPNIVHCD